MAIRSPVRARSPVRTRSRNVRENKTPPTSTKADTAEDRKTRRHKSNVYVLVPSSNEKRIAFPGNHRKRRRINILERPETVDIDYPKAEESVQPKCIVSALPVRRNHTAKPVDDSGAGQTNADKLFKDTSPMCGAHTDQDHRMSKSGRRTSVLRDSDLQKPTRASQVFSGTQYSFAPPSRIPSRIHSCNVSSSRDCMGSTSTVWDAGLDATSRLSRQALAAYIFSLPLDEFDVSDIEKPSDALPVSSSLSRAGRSPERSKPGMFRIETPRPHARLFDSTTNISTSDSTLPSSFDDVEQMLQSIGLVNDRSSSLSISVGSSSSSLDAVEQLLTTPRLEESSACVSLRACPPDAPSYTYPSSLCLPVSPNDNHAESFSACGETLQLPMATCSPVAFTTPSSPVMQAHCPSQGNTMPSNVSIRGRRVFGFCHLVLAFVRGALMGLGGLFFLLLAWIYFCYELPEDRLQTFAL